MVQNGLKLSKLLDFKALKDFHENPTNSCNCNIKDECSLEEISLIMYGGLLRSISALGVSLSERGLQFLILILNNSRIFT